MQPLKIIIPGNFWDIQIYRDRLYLWDMDGGLSTYNWDESFESLLMAHEDQKLAIKCAFSRGDYLYNENFDLIFNDSEFKQLLQNKFHNAPREIELSLEMRAKQENPFKELPIDSEIYNSQLYALTSSGLLSATAHRKSEKYPVSSKPVKQWDAYLQSIRANSNTLALSGGSEGLFEYAIKERNIYSADFFKPETDITQLSSKHSLYSTWAFSSIYSSSDVGNSYLIANYWETQYGQTQLRHGSLFDDNDIFSEVQQGALSWAENEKIYLIDNSRIKVINFNQSQVAPDSDNSPFHEVTTQNIELENQDVVMADTAQYGTIIEDMNGLTVYRSDGQLFRIDEPITRWRIYPRSKRYENHLHVILDDRIEIYSFNHDYFVDQKSKIFGIQHRGLQKSKFKNMRSTSFFDDF